LLPHPVTDICSNTFQKTPSDAPKIASNTLQATATTGTTASADLALLKGGN